MTRSISFAILTQEYKLVLTPERPSWRAPPFGAAADEGTAALPRLFIISSDVVSPPGLRPLDGVVGNGVPPEISETAEITPLFLYVVWNFYCVKT